MIPVRRRFLPVAALSLALGVAAVGAAAPALSVEPVQPRSFCPTCKPQPVQFTVRGLDPAAASVHVTLKHRKESLILPTGFPFMQGATLFEGDFSPVQGAVAVTAILPIRGDYVFSAESKAKDGSVEKVEQVVPVLDAGEMVLNLRLMVAILLGLGLLCGYIFGRRSLTAALGLLLALTLAPGAVQAHEGHGDGGPAAPAVTVQTVGGWMAHCIVSPSPASVGTRASIQFHLMDAKGRAVKGPFEIGLDVELTEDEVVVYHAATQSADGAWTTHYGFFDGSEHRLTFHVRSLKDQHSADFSFDTGVSAHQPPAEATRKSMGFLMALFIVGLGGGLALGRARSAGA